MLRRAACVMEVHATHTDPLRFRVAKKSAFPLPSSYEGPTIVWCITPGFFKSRLQACAASCQRLLRAHSVYAFRSARKGYRIRECQHDHHVANSERQSTSEAGCIGAGRSTTTCGITQVGKIKNSSSLGSVPTGTIDASNLRFIFNASQPAGGSITLQQLEVSFFGSTGLLYEANLASSPVTLTSTLPGVGNSGFSFQLNTSEAATVNGLWSSIVDIGGGFSSTTASLGPDTLFLGAVPGRASAPEPASVVFVDGAFVLAGSLLLAGLRKVRRSK